MHYDKCRFKVHHSTCTSMKDDAHMLLNQVLMGFVNWVKMEIRFGVVYRICLTKCVIERDGVIMINIVFFRICKKKICWII